MNISNEANELQINASMLVVIDAAVDDYELLASSVVSGSSVVVLTPDQDGIAQITQAIQKAVVPVTSLHIVSHGGPGVLYLGNTQLSLETLSHYTPQIFQWFASSSSLISSPSLLLYGCNVAAGDAGAEFIEKLHNSARASISASKTLVGSAQKGGSWQLTEQLGHKATVEQSGLAFTQAALDQYASVFGKLTFALNSIAGPAVGLTGNISFDDPGNGTFTLNQLSNLVVALNLGSEVIPQAQSYFDLSELQDSQSQVSVAVGGTGLNRTATFSAVDGFLSFTDTANGNKLSLNSTTFSTPFLISEIGGPYLTTFQAPSPDSDGNLTAGPLVEPNFLKTSVDTLAEAVPVFDFTLADAGTNDGLSLGVTSIKVNVTSSTSDPSKVTWLLSGPDLTNDVQGIYQNGVITFSGLLGLPISVADKASETYTVKAYYNNTTGLVDGQGFVLSIDGDTDVTVGANGTKMGPTTPVTTGLNVNPFDTDGSLTAGPLAEPSALAVAINTPAEAAAVLDFTLADGGGSDGLSVNVNQVKVQVSGDVSEANRGKITWLLSGPDILNGQSQPTDVQGSYLLYANSEDISSTGIQPYKHASNLYKSTNTVPRHQIDGEALSVQMRLEILESVP